MRDPLDNLTAEIPGESPPPPPPARVKTAQAREACGYMGPKLTMTCRNCTARVEKLLPAADGRGFVVLHRCGRHGFPVELGATCRDFTA